MATRAWLEVNLRLLRTTSTNSQGPSQLRGDLNMMTCRLLTQVVATSGSTFTVRELKLPARRLNAIRFNPVQLCHADGGRLSLSQKEPVNTRSTSRVDVLNRSLEDPRPATRGPIAGRGRQLVACQNRSGLPFGLAPSKKSHPPHISALLFFL